MSTCSLNFLFHENRSRAPFDRPKIDGRQDGSNLFLLQRSPCCAGAWLKMCLHILRIDRSSFPRAPCAAGGATDPTRPRRWRHAEGHSQEGDGRCAAGTRPACGGAGGAGGAGGGGAGRSGRRRAGGGPAAHAVGRLGRSAHPDLRRDRGLVPGGRRGQRPAGVVDLRRQRPRPGPAPAGVGRARTLHAGRSGGPRGRAAAGLHPRGRELRQGRGHGTAARPGLRPRTGRSTAPAWTTSPSCSSPSSTWTGTSASGPTTASTRTAPRRWAGAPTPRNLNLNRDYLKADTPEMQAWLRPVAGLEPRLLHRRPQHRRRRLPVRPDLQPGPVPGRGPRPDGLGRPVRGRHEGGAGGRRLAHHPLRDLPGAARSPQRTARLGGDAPLQPGLRGGPAPAGPADRDPHAEGLPDAGPRGRRHDRPHPGLGGRPRRRVDRR